MRIPSRGARALATSAAIAIALSTPAVRPADGQSTPPGNEAFRGELRPPARDIVRQIPNVRGPGLWTVTLQFDRPDRADLDLAVFGARPGSARGAEALCRSDGEGREEQCRAVLPDSADGLWVQVSATRGSERVSFRVFVAQSGGTALGKSGLTSDGARQVTVGAVIDTAFQILAGPGGVRHVYHVSVPAASAADTAYLALAATTAGAAVRLSVYDQTGREAMAERPSAQSQQLPLPSGRGFYVVAQLMRRGVAREGVGYQMRVTRARERLPLAVSTEPVVNEGLADRTYDMTLPAYHAAALALDGPGYELEVIAPEGTATRVDRALGGARQLTLIGRPLSTLESVLASWSAPRTYRVTVKGLGERVEYRKPWRLVVLGVEAPNFRPALLSFPMDSAQVWRAPGDRLAGQLTSQSDARGFSVTWMTRSAAAAAGQQPSPSGAVRGLTARWAVRLPRGIHDMVLDVAVVDEFGRIIDIGSSSAEWTWTDDQTGVYLVTFPADPVGARRLAGQPIHMTWEAFPTKGD